MNMDSLNALYTISQDRNKIRPERVHSLLSQTYWAKDRSLETVKTAMDHSLLYGVFERDTDQMIAFARVLTDYSTTWYLADVIVEETHRGLGLGKLLIEHITADPRLFGYTGMLVTRDAHGLYEQFGFRSVENTFMRKD